MARLFTGGFESGDLLLDGWVASEVNNGTGATPNSGANFPPTPSSSINEHRTLDGTNGGLYGLKMSTSAGNQVITVDSPTITGNPNDIFMRICFRKAQSSNTGSALLALYDQSSTLMGTLQIGTIASDRLSFCNHLAAGGGLGVDGGAVVVTSSAGHTIPDSATVFTRLDIHWTISGGKLNLVELRVNDSPWTEMVGSGVGPGGATGFGKFKLLGGNNAQAGGNVSVMIFDDIAVNDTTGSNNNSFCGNGFIQALLPNAAGTFTQLFNSIGNQTNNYSYVNTLPTSANGSNAVGTATAGDKDTYNVGDLPAPALGVNVVTLAAYAVKNGVGVTNANVVGIFNSVENDGGSIALPVGSPNWLSRTLEVNPNTSLPFTRSDINSMEVGIKFLA